MESRDEMHLQYLVPCDAPGCCYITIILAVLPARSTLSLNMLLDAHSTARFGGPQRKCHCTNRSAGAAIPTYRRAAASVRVPMAGKATFEQSYSGRDTAVVVTQSNRQCVPVDHR